MSKIAIGVFLMYYGVTLLVNTNLPPWMTGVLGLGAGLVCLLEGVKGAK